MTFEDSDRDASVVVDEGVLASVRSGAPLAVVTVPWRWVISPTAGVMPSLTMSRSLSVSSGITSG